VNCSVEVRWRPGGGGVRRRARAAGTAGERGSAARGGGRLRTGRG
jgi:hypothetical protein